MGGSTPARDVLDPYLYEHVPKFLPGSDFGLVLLDGIGFVLIYRFGGKKIRGFLDLVGT